MVVRSRVSIAALASLALGAAVLAPIPAQAGDAGTIVIALEAPLTGSQAANGQDMLRGAQLAAKEVNARGGVLGRKVKVVGVDDKADPSLGAQAVRKAQAAGDVAVIGPYNSSVGLVNLSLLLRTVEVKRGVTVTSSPRHFLHVKHCEISLRRGTSGCSVGGVVIDRDAESQ